MYETAENLSAEEAVLIKLKKKWRCEGYKLPLAYQVDYVLVTDRIKAFVEIKCRGQKYDEMYLSLHKWMKGKELSLITGVPFILVYAFQDEVWWKPVQHDLPVFTVGGRTDRKDWQDIEPMAVFKLKEFKRLGE